MERQIVTGVAYSKDEAELSIRKVADKPGIAANIFGSLADAGINVDMIVQVISPDGKTTDITLTLLENDFQRAKDVLNSSLSGEEFETIEGETDITKVSVIGIGMRSNAGIATSCFRGLADKGINIRAISTSEIKLSVLIDSDQTELAVRTLQNIYGLDKV